jgi:hypothetical protein
MGLLIEQSFPQSTTRLHQQQSASVSAVRQHTSMPPGMCASQCPPGTMRCSETARSHNRRPAARPGRLSSARPSVCSGDARPAQDRPLPLAVGAAGLVAGIDSLQLHRFRLWRPYRRASAQFLAVVRLWRRGTGLGGVRRSFVGDPQTGARHSVRHSRWAAGNGAARLLSRSCRGRSLGAVVEDRRRRPAVRSAGGRGRRASSDFRGLAHRQTDRRPLRPPRPLYRGARDVAVVGPGGEILDPGFAVVSPRRTSITSGPCRRSVRLRDREGRLHRCIQRLLDETEGSSAGSDLRREPLLPGGLGGGGRSLGPAPARRREAQAAVRCTAPTRKASRRTPPGR